MNLRDIRCFLLDMDGTFYLGDQILAGSLDFIKTLRQTGREFLFLTNNSSHNAEYYVKKLSRMGLEIPRSKVLTSGEATAQIVAQQYPGARAFVLGNNYLREELMEAGIALDDRNPEYMIVGYDTTLDYKKMTDACDFARAGLPMIATHPDFNCPTETGFAPDIGAILAFIKASTGRDPDLVVGKPYGGIVDAALARTGFAREQLAMVGDRLYTDIETGLRHDMTAILVMTGETTREMLATSETRPHLIYERLSDMIPELQEV